MRFAVGAVALSIAGCGAFYQAHTEIRAERMESHLQPGQSVTEVRDKWGEPDIRTDIDRGQIWSYAARPNRNDIVAELIYTGPKEGDAGKFIDLKFIDGKLQSWAEAEHTMPPKEQQHFGMRVGNPGGATHF